MTSTEVLRGPALSAAPTASARGALFAIGLRWVLAHVLPQVLLIAMLWVYLDAAGASLADLRPGALTRLPHPVWTAIGIAALYAAAMGFLRGAVLRPRVPRFSIPGWCLATIPFGIVMLALTVAGSMVGMLVAKGLVGPGGRPALPPDTPFALFLVGVVLVSEILGLVAGGVPGLVVGAVEALVFGRASRALGRWMIWTAAAWAGIMTIIVLEAFLVALFPGLSSAVLVAMAVSMPILFGVIVAVVTLPAVMKLVAREHASGPTA